jgi:DoxX-like family
MSNSTNSTRPRWLVTAYWVSTILFALQISSTAYAQLQIPHTAALFAHLGFPDYFRIELSWAKLVGVAALLIPIVPARLKEWAYAGFAITLVSALIAHFAVGDGIDKWIWVAGTAVFWGLSYFFYCRLPAKAAIPVISAGPGRQQALTPTR